MITDPDLTDKIIDDIAGQGWSVVDGLFPVEMLDEMIAEVHAAWNEGDFSKAGIGAGTQHKVRPEIRTDKVLWLDEDNLTLQQQRYRSFIDNLRDELNRALFLSARTFEAHFAVYPEGSFYKKHLDQHQTVQHRLITCILYLNEDWTEEDGGLLRIYTGPDHETDFIDLLPEKGRFVCFRSDTVFHEVLPSRRERFSLTGWLRRESLDDGINMNPGVAIK